MTDKTTLRRELRAHVDDGDGGPARAHLLHQREQRTAERHKIAQRITAQQRDRHFEEKVTATLVRCGKNLRPMLTEQRLVRRHDNRPSRQCGECHFSGQTGPTNQFANNLDRRILCDAQRIRG